MLFDASGNSLGTSQMEHNQVFPRAGWVEHDPMEIWSHTRRVMADVLALSEYSGTDIAALGITNQRETTVVWDRAASVHLLLRPENRLDPRQCSWSTGTGRRR